MDLETRNKIITIILGVVIIFLGYYLYRSIVDPYQEVLQQQEMTERVQHRMGLVRDALIQYRNERGEFPPSDGGLDSLINFLKTNERMVQQGETLFEEQPPSLTIRTLSNTHRDHRIIEFEYTLNDTLRPQIYLLEDPDSDMRIGDLERTTLLNAPNWN
jgi:type II secretory pathway pseudopilin PulG